MIVLTGQEPKIIITSGGAQEKVAAFVKYLKEENLLPQSSGAIADVAGADRVLCVGLGLKKKEDLAMMDGLADALHAALGCSRPFAEEKRWMPMGRFVGISGQKFKGGFYLGIGVSGQIQHLAGIREGKVITAINIDPQAPIFENVDYGIVGDMYEIVPLLSAALQKA